MVIKGFKKIQVDTQKFRELKFKAIFVGFEGSEDVLGDPEGFE